MAQSIMRRTWSTRNNEFLKYVSQGAGLGRIKHCVLDADAFPLLPVDEGAVREKKIARKGQVITRSAATQLWGPLKRAEVATAGAATTDTTFVVGDATMFGVGDELTIAGVTGTRTVTAVDYDTNTVTVDAELGVIVAEDAAVSIAEYGVDYDDMAVLGDEFDLSNGDKAGPGYYLHCIFYRDNLFGYAGNEAEVAAGLGTCEFEARVDPTAV